MYKNGFLECKQQAQVQGNTPTYVRPNIYQEPDTNVVIFCLFTVEMKFIQICNRQTFLWAAGLKRARWVWMEWEEMKGKGGGEEENLPCQNLTYTN